MRNFASWDYMSLIKNIENQSKTQRGTPKVNNYPVNSYISYRAYRIKNQNEKKVVSGAKHNPLFSSHTLSMQNIQSRLPVMLKNRTEVRINPILKKDILLNNLMKKKRIGSVARNCTSRDGHRSTLGHSFVILDANIPVLQQQRNLLKFQTSLDFNHSKEETDNINNSISNSNQIYIKESYRASKNKNPMIRNIKLENSLKVTSVDNIDSFLDEYVMLDQIKKNYNDKIYKKNIETNRTLNSNNVSISTSNMNIKSSIKSNKRLINLKTQKIKFNSPRNKDIGVDTGIGFEQNENIRYKIWDLSNTQNKEIESKLNSNTKSNYPPENISNIMIKNCIARSMILNPKSKRYDLSDRNGSNKKLEIPSGLNSNDGSKTKIIIFSKVKEAN